MVRIPTILQEIIFTDPPQDSEQDVSPDTKPQAAAVRANNPIPPYTNGFYFEITIVDEGDTRLGSHILLLRNLSVV